MISTFTKNGFVDKALKHFHQMQLSDVNPNVVTMMVVILVCAQSGALEQGNSIHGYMIRNLYELNVFVETTFIDIYVKCGT